MTLNEFKEVLGTVPAPARNDREECTAAIAALLSSAALDDAEAALHARQIALALDLFQETGLRPLYLWIDDRDQSRLPTGTLPYTITLASALHALEDGSFAISVWELAQRENRLSLLQHHANLPSPFQADTSLSEILNAPSPSHALYQENRFGPPYRYKPETDTFMDAQGGPPDISAQSRFLRQRHHVGMAL